jgi:predicted nucleic-acid-binding Zn-ribbon protein
LADIQDGYCPRCDSTEIYKSAARSLLVEQKPLVLNIEEPRWSNGDPLLIDCYICQECGYMELYAHNPAKLAKLSSSSNWTKVDS